MVDASRQLRGAQDNALHGLEGQLIAPLDRFIRPGVDTVVSPEERFHTAQQRNFWRSAPEVEILAEGDWQATADGQRHHIDRAGVAARGDVGVVDVSVLEDAIVNDDAIAPPVDIDIHPLAHRVTFAHVLAPVHEHLRLLAQDGFAAVGVVGAGPDSGQLVPQVGPHSDHPFDGHQSHAFGVVVQIPLQLRQVGDDVHAKCSVVVVLHVRIECRAENAGIGVALTSCDLNVQARELPLVGDHALPDQSQQPALGAHGHVDHL